MQMKLTRRSRFRLTLLAIIVIVLIGVMDDFTGPEVSLSILYVGPVVLLTLVGGIRLGVVASLACAAMSFGVDMDSANNGASARQFLLLNAVVRGFVLVTIAVLFGKLLKSNEQLVELEAEKTARHEATLRTSIDGFWQLDTQGRFLEVNEIYCQMSGYGNQELLTMRVADLEARESAGEIAAHIQKTIVTGEDCFESRHRRKDGSVYPVEINVRYQSHEGGQMVAFVRDITERKLAEHHLQEREALLATTIASTVDGILVVDNSGRTILTNRRFAELWQIPEGLLSTGNDAAMLDYVLSQLVDPEAFLLKVKLLYTSDEAEMDTLHFKSGRILERNSLPLISAGTHIGRLWSFRDVTEGQRALQVLQESEQLLSEAQSLAHAGSYVLDIPTGHWTSSPALNDLFGIDLTFDRSVEGWQALIHPGDRAMMSEYFSHEVLDRKQAFHKHYRIIRQDDRSERWVHGAGTLHFDAEGRPLQMRGSIQDITERKQVEEAMQVSLREKEALLKEVHHRVKNNLQVITSLLGLESARSAHPDTKTVLEEMRGRIRSMALLHEALYHSGVVAGVDLGDYIRQLAKEAFTAQNSPPGSVQLRLDLASVRAEMDQALPCGLVVNELLANCLEHGFPDGHRGEVLVELHSEDEGRRLRLRISDTGVGLPADFATRRNDRLGLQLVGDLAGQLRGTLEIGSGPAAVFTMTFPAKSG